MRCTGHKIWCIVSTNNPIHSYNYSFRQTKMRLWFFNVTTTNQVLDRSLCVIIGRSNVSTCKQVSNIHHNLFFTRRLALIWWIMPVVCDTTKVSLLKTKSPVTVNMKFMKRLFVYEMIQQEKIMDFCLLCTWTLYDNDTNRRVETNAEYWILFRL